MRPYLLFLVTSCVFVGGGCSVGSGVGAASGSLYVYGCSKDGDYCSGGQCGTESAPAPYDLRPSFFAGEPIDDLREFTTESETAIMSNRLIIRLQSSGKQIESNDILTVDVANSYEVARCVRGRVDDGGKNDWDPNDCYRASDNGPGRVRLQFDSSVHAALTLGATCGASTLARAISSQVAVAISSPVPDSYTTTPRPVVSDGSWSSWVEFQEFGSASQSGLEPRTRDAIKGKFRVEFGERIYATAFFVTLIDSGVVEAAISNLQRPPAHIGGVLGGDPATGRFDFDLQRGQGAQFFP
jgi:hypothetical protein